MAIVSYLHRFFHAETCLTLSDFVVGEESVQTIG